MVGTVPRATLCPLGTASILPAQDWELCMVQEQLEPSFHDLGREVSLSQPHVPPPSSLGWDRSHVLGLRMAPGHWDLVAPWGESRPQKPLRGTEADAGGSVPACLSFPSCWGMGRGCWM